MKKYWLMFGLFLFVPCFVFGQWVFNDFEGDPYWGGSQVDREDDIETKAIISYVSDHVMFDSAAMRIDWGAPHTESWGGGSYLGHFHRDSIGVYDFSEYDSLIFWYYNDVASDIPGAVHLRFNLSDVSDSENGEKTYDFAKAEYWYSFHYILGDEPEWKKISIPLADVRYDPNGNGFERLGWYGIEGNDYLDLDMIKAFQMEFSINATEGDVATGTIILDNMKLVTEGYTSVERLTFNNPTTYSLSQNYPNPFNPITNIQFNLPENQQVAFKIIDLKGSIVDVEKLGYLKAGYHTFRYNASKLSSGTYIYRLETNRGESISRKFLLIK